MYCPNCGSQNNDIRLEANNTDSLICGDCGSYFNINEDIEAKEKDKEQEDRFSCSKCGKIITGKTFNRNGGMCSTCWEERNE